MNTLEITSSTDNIVKVEKFIDTLNDLFGISNNLYGKIKLAVIEAVNNAIFHGNQQKQDKKIILTAKMDKDLVITIEDEGAGFDYTFIPDPTIPDNIGKTTGRGLYLIKALSDNLTFEKNGAKIILSFKML